MLADLSGKAQLRRHHEGRADGAQPIGQHLPIIALQYHAQVRHRHPVLADLSDVRACERCAPVERNLVAEKVEVDPGRRAAACAATEHTAVEGARRVQVVPVVGEVEQAFQGRLSEGVICGIVLR